jgi:hypothetical protein
LGRQNGTFFELAACCRHLPVRCPAACTAPHPSCAAPPQTGLGAEGPAVFRHGGRHYLFASHLTGWDPNPPLLHESTAGGMCSTFWRLLPQPSHGPLGGTTYNAQACGGCGCV